LGQFLGYEENEVLWARHKLIHFGSTRKKSTEDNGQKRARNLEKNNSNMLTHLLMQNTEKN
jgi:hypothetical protein